MVESTIEMPVVSAAAERQSFLVYPPHAIVADEPRLTRLGQSLRAEFPQFAFIVAAENPFAGNESGVATLASRTGEPVLAKAELDQATAAILDAMRVFANQADRLH